MNINMTMVISGGSPTLPTLQLTTLSVHRSLPRFLFQGLSFLSFSKVSFLLQGLSFLFQGLSVLFQGVSHRGPCFLFLLRCSWLHVGSYNFPIHALNKFSIQVSLTILSLRNGKRRPAGGNFNLIIFSGISCSRDLKSGVFFNMTHILELDAENGKVEPVCGFQDSWQVFATNYSPETKLLITLEAIKVDKNQSPGCQ